MVLAILCGDRCSENGAKTASKQCFLVKNVVLFGRFFCIPEVFFRNYARKKV